VLHLGLYDSRKVLACPHLVAGQTRSLDAQVASVAWGVIWVNVYSVDCAVVAVVGIEQFVKFYAKGAVVDPPLRSRRGEPLYGPGY